jgi:hypothetical protein
MRNGRSSIKHRLPATALDRAQVPGHAGGSGNGAFDKQQPQPRTGERLTAGSREIVIKEFAN